MPFSLLRAEWGKASAEQPAEFRAELAKFMASIDETIRGMGAGIVLSKPRKDIDLDVSLRQATAGNGPSIDTIRAFESKFSS